jgi:hypothetical protein
MKNPILEKKYWEGYNLGHTNGVIEGKQTGVAYFAVRLERLENIPGFGPKRLEAIRKAIEEDMTPEEVEKAQGYVVELQKNAAKVEKGR